MIINVDSDGCVYNFHERFSMLVKQHVNRAIWSPKTYYPGEEWGVDQDLLDRLIHENPYSLFSGGRPYPNAIETLHQLVDDGHRVRMITDKNYYPTSEKTLKAQHATLEWYDKMDLLHRVEFVFTRMKREYTADVVIDDKPTLAWTQAGALNILPDRTWNQSDELAMLEPGTRLDRVSSWDEIYTLITNHHHGETIAT